MGGLQGKIGVGTEYLVENSILWFELVNISLAKMPDANSGMLVNGAGVGQ